MRKSCIIGILSMMMLFSSCGFKDANLNVPQITVTSASIDSDGKLLTETAADKSPNSPLGSNKSPQLSWDAVNGAASYTVCMFDEDANWLHWFVTDVQNTTLGEGYYTDKKQYVGPYPPKSAGRHHYRIEVFALKQKPDRIAVKMDSINSYKDIVNQLNKENGKSDNILARGYIVGTYANGDNNL